MCCTLLFYAFMYLCIISTYIIESGFCPSMHIISPFAQWLSGAGISIFQFLVSTFHKDDGHPMTRLSVVLPGHLLLFMLLAVYFMLVLSMAIQHRY